MIRSKYFGKGFDNGWVCVEVGLANVQTKKRKRPGHRNYKYCFIRLTSDGKADKQVWLNSKEVSKVGKGLITVESIADKRKAKKEQKASRGVSYVFCDQDR